LISLATSHWHCGRFARIMGQRIRHRAAPTCELRRPHIPIVRNVSRVHAGWRARCFRAGGMPARYVPAHLESLWSDPQTRLRSARETTIEHRRASSFLIRRAHDAQLRGRDYL